MKKLFTLLAILLNHWSFGQSFFCGTLPPSINRDSLIDAGEKPLISDRFGNVYTPEMLIIPAGQNSGNYAARHPVPTCDAGIFRLYFMDVINGTQRGFDDRTAYIGPGINGIFGTNPTVGFVRAQTVCRVFTDLSNFLITPNNNTRVNIEVTSSEQYRGLYAVATSFFMNYGAYDFIDNIVWECVNTGQDPWVTMFGSVPPYSSVGNQNSQAFHGKLNYYFNAVNEIYHYDTSATDPSRVDFYTVSLHEVFHLLGFGSLIDSDGGSKMPIFAPNFSRYDRFITYNNTPLLNSAGVFGHNPNILILGCTSTVHLTSSMGSSLPEIIYNTAPWEPATSLSHFECRCHSSGSQHVMSACGGLGMNFTHRSPTQEDVDALCLLGYRRQNNWPGRAQAYTPCNSNCLAVGTHDRWDRLGNPYTAIVGQPLDLTDLLSNDIGQNLSISNLKLEWGPSTGNSITRLSDTSVRVLITNQIDTGRNINSRFVFSYRPRCNINDSTNGNRTFIFIDVIPRTPDCNPSNDCNLICGGDFENRDWFIDQKNISIFPADLTGVYVSRHVGFSPYSWIQSTTDSNLVQIIFVLSNIIFNIPNLINRSAVSAGTASSSCFTDGVYGSYPPAMPWQNQIYHRIVNNWWNTNGLTILNRGTLRFRLHTPVVPGRSYEISFWAAANFSCPAFQNPHVHVIGSVTPPCLGSNPTDIRPGAVSACGYTPDFQFSIPITNAMPLGTQSPPPLGLNPWQRYSVTITPTVPIEHLILALDPIDTTNFSIFQAEVFIDEIRMEQVNQLPLRVTARSTNLRPCTGEEFELSYQICLQDSLFNNNPDSIRVSVNIPGGFVYAGGDMDSLGQATILPQTISHTTCRTIRLRLRPSLPNANRIYQFGLGVEGGACLNPRLSSPNIEIYPTGLSLHIRRTYSDSILHGGDTLNANIRICNIGTSNDTVSLSIPLPQGTGTPFNYSPYIMVYDSLNHKLSAHFPIESVLTPNCQDLRFSIRIPTSGICIGDTTEFVLPIVIDSTRIPCNRTSVADSFLVINDQQNYTFSHQIDSTSAITGDVFYRITIFNRSQNRYLPLQIIDSSAGILISDFNINHQLHRDSLAPGDSISLRIGIDVQNPTTVCSTVPVQHLIQLITPCGTIHDTLSHLIGAPGSIPPHITTVSQAIAQGFLLPVAQARTTAQNRTVLGVLSLDLAQYYFAPGSNIRFAPGAGIDIEYKCALYLDSTILRSCGLQQWRGIRVLDYALLHSNQNTVIRDAQYGIEAQKESNLFIRQTRFLNNYVGIYVAPSPTLKNINLYDFSGNSFNCNANLLPPYPGQTPSFGSGQKSRAGIFIHDVVNWHIQPNRPNPITTNVFRGDLINGIISYRSNLVITNCQFIGIRTQSSTQNRTDGIALVALGDVNNIYSLKQFGLGYTATSTASFQNCDQGIFVQQMNVSISQNNMVGIGNTGVQVRLCQNREITILNNRIESDLYGLRLFQNDPSLSLQVESNQLTIGRAIFNPPVLGVATAIEVRESARSHFANYLRNQITLRNSGSFGFWFQTCKNTNVHNNQVSLLGLRSTQRIGLFTQGCDNLYLSCNQIQGNNNLINSADTSLAGIRTEMSQNMYWFCNQTNRLNIGFHARFDNLSNQILGHQFQNHKIGLYLSDSAIISNQNHTGNRWIGNSLGSGNTEALALRSPIGRSQFLVDPSTNPDLMPAPVIPGVIWFRAGSGNTYDCNANPLCTPPSPRPLAGILTNLDSILVYQPDDLPLPVQHRAAEHLYQKLSEHPDLQTGDFALFFAQYPYQQQNLPLKQAQTWDSLLQVQQMVHQNNKGQISQGLEQVHQTDSLLNQTYCDSLQQIKQIKLDSLNLDYQGCQQDQNNVQQTKDSVVNVYLSTQLTWTASDWQMEYSKQVQNIYWQSVAKGRDRFSPAELRQLEHIAYSCPWQFGTAVHWARSLLSLNEDLPYWMDQLCDNNNQQARPKQVEDFSAQILPNPNRGHFEVRWLGHSSFDLRILDAYGRVLFAQSQAQAHQRLDLQHLAPGTYFVLLQDQDQQELVLWIKQE